MARQRPKTAATRAKANKSQRANWHIYGPRYRAKRRAYKQKRRASDPIFRLKENVSAVIRMACRRKGTRKSSHTNDLIGCTYEFFRGWLESQFTPAITWANYGRDWHVDHILSLALFDATDLTAWKMACNYRNCRPLWGQDNLQKNCRFDPKLAEQYNLQAWVPFIQTENIIPFIQAA